MVGVGVVELVVGAGAGVDDEDVTIARRTGTTLDERLLGDGIGTRVAL
jgi:hypothetical protein